jgi:predicted Zn-dependent protease with MMP-like domain
MKRPVISDPRGWTTCVIPACRHDATETAVRSDPDERMPQRGVYGVGLDTCYMVDVDPQRFEVMVSEALDGIPAELGELMSNVAVTVQHDSGPAGLLGLYQGVPLTRRSTFYAGALPDRITIYRRAICAVCNSDSEVVEQVRRTVIHEVGHHFGIGDARLRELGW